MRRFCFNWIPVQREPSGFDAEVDGNRLIGVVGDNNGDVDFVGRSYFAVTSLDTISLRCSYNFKINSVIFLLEPGLSSTTLSMAFNGWDPSDPSFSFGQAGDVPIVGDWAYPPAAPLRVAGGEIAPGPDVLDLTDVQLSVAVTEAIRLWEAAGLDPAQVGINEHLVR